VWRIPDAHLATRKFIEGDHFTLADIALGAYARRWFGVEGVSTPRFPNLERWFAQFASRPGFEKFIATPMS
jgi:glutathione S-transferase